MLNMFKALEASGLRGFLGCESMVYEKELEQFFDTALVQDGDITGAISGKYFSVSQSQFAEIFALPTEGLVTFSDVPKHLVYKARSIFSKSGEQVEIHGKKRFLKYEYRLLNDILAKAITVKAGSFDVVTTERFQMMTAIQFGLKNNWSKIVFNVLKEMVDRTQKKAKGYAAQIGVLLKSIPAITIGEGVSFQASKILSMKTINTYIATNQTIDARGQTEEQGMASEAIVKRKSKSKKKSVSTDDTPVEVIAEIAGSKKRPATEDSIGYPCMKASGESSTTKHRLLHASGPHPIPPPNDPNDSEVQSIPEIDSDSSDGCTVYRSPSPISQEADSSDHDLQFALGPDTSDSSTDSPMLFTRDDIPLDATTDDQTSIPPVSTDLSTSLANFQTILSEHIDASQADVRKEVQEMNAKVDIMSSRLDDVRKDVEATKEAISHQLLEFQSQAQANYIILTDHLGQLVDYINRGGNDKKGEGESSRGPQPPPAVQIRDSGNAGGSGDAVRTTEITQADIDAANRQIMERMMREDREREKERRIMISGCSESGFGTVELSILLFGLSNQLFGLSGHKSTVDGVLRMMKSTNSFEYCIGDDICQHHLVLK
ncbi:hypothetical protein F511_03557 [Dorcoceras hygrometricum]|uniref:Dystroglycan-like n=1 Tax=Dorcoceras hygrometricum TaxID=472368 RepID=A0A2Z7B0N3_9LAMI|nr:hypothetical protein F511_03557 [Dorcoceras hygrometricum]